MSDFKIRQGVRYRLVYTHNHRWGFGKTHMEYYDKLNKAWLLECAPGQWHNTSLQTEPPMADECCKKCLPSIERVFGPLSNNEAGK